jgi:hypothetical protein
MAYRNPADQKRASDKWYREHKAHHITNCGRNTKRYRREAKEAICKYLETHPCVDCGETDIVVLEFDHIKGKKHKDIAIMAASGYSITRIMREIEKCNVVCANDHRRRTAQRGKHFRTKRPSSSTR